LLRWRLVSSAVIISILVLLLWLDVQHNLGRPGIWISLVGYVVVLLGTSELLHLLSLQNLRPVTAVTYIGSVGVFAAACVPVYWQDYPADCPIGGLGWPLLALAFGVGSALIGEMWRFKSAGGVIMNVASSIFVMAYVGLLLSFLVPLRVFQSNYVGFAALLSVFVIVKVSDTGAYTVGRLIGRHKMAPALSPGKTIEGAIGALVTACLCSVLYFQFLVPILVGSPAETEIWASALYGVIIGIVGMIGDLAESLIKRDCGQKDSSTWMPGLGGVLDVTDSVLAAAPAAYACWAAGLVRG